MAYFDDHRSSWNAIGGLMFLVVLSQAVLAMVAVAGLLPPTGPTLFPIAAATAIGSIVIALRCRMPRWAKAGGSVTLAMGLLMISATQDVFGIRAVDQSVKIALKGSDAPPPVIPVSGGGIEALATVQIGIRPHEARDDNGFAEALNRKFAASPAHMKGQNVEIEGDTDYKHADDTDTYGLSWSIRRGNDSTWCGRASISTRDRTMAVDTSRDIIGHAITASSEDQLRCRVSGVAG